LAKGIFIIGTDTGIGKTVVAAGLMHLLLSKGYKACYFKPISSGMVKAGNDLVPTDVCFVKKASGLEENEQYINPVSFKTPVSPHLASRIESSAIDMEVIKERLQHLKSRYDYIIAEGCGGIAVPLRDDGYMLYQLIQELGFVCFLVAGTGLGTINHTLLTVRYAQSMGIVIRGILMNGYTRSSLEDDNVETIRKLAGLPVLSAVPALEGVDVEGQKTGNLKDVFDKIITVEEVIKAMCEL